MEYWYLNSLLIFTLCVLLAGILIPQILLIAYRRNLFDEVDERKIHKGLIPRLGGIAFVPVIFTSIALCLAINHLLGYNQLSESFVNIYTQLLCAFISLELLYLVGIADDLIGIKYRAKFVMQILCAISLIVGGAWFKSFSGALGVWDISPWIGYPFSLIVIVFILNAINLIDGLDGLCSGLSSLACVIYGFSFLYIGRYAYAMLAFAQLGVLVPFFYYNVFGNVKKHSKIFMGDTGALTMGLILALLGIELYTSMDAFDVNFNPAVAAFSPLIVPCFDVIRVYMLRIRHHRSPFLPDKSHIHHKLLEYGLKPRNAMACIVATSLLLCTVNFVMSFVFQININIIIALDVTVWVIGNILLSAKIKARKKVVEA